MRAHSQVGSLKAVPGAILEEVGASAAVHELPRLRIIGGVVGVSDIRQHRAVGEPGVSPAQRPPPIAISISYFTFRALDNGCRKPL